ncbi:uncharacterized protein LOC135213454 [Macrobrachium nipponense]|uniref:uncharacterized protein LOC135213454 n=1 Tax=Macrobrachium nipponense TaxID=159736 RepID=UPI0030C7F632
MPPAYEKILVLPKYNGLLPSLDKATILIDMNCSLTLTSTEPAWAKITFNSFTLETGCGDYVSFTKPYNFGEAKLCDTQNGEIMLPSFNSVGTFFSNAATNAAGFDLTVTKMTSSCHKVITLTIGSSSTLETPSVGSNMWTRNACEWWITSPAGTKIQLKSSKLLVRNCNSEGVLVNQNGDSSYPTASTSAICGRSASLQTTSNGNKMAVLFYSNRARSGMVAVATVVAA